MFIGHFAVGLAAKRAAPDTSLGWLIAAPIALDLLWPLFLLAGWEQVRIDPGNTAFTPLDFISYPWSHSLLMSAVWGVVLALLYWLLTRRRAGAIVIGLLVVSHWVLDALTHRPDLPLYPGSATLVGLGLWNHFAATIVVESAMFVAAVWMYVKTTKPRDRIGRYAFWAFITFLALIDVGNISGSPPPNAQAIATVTLAMWIFPLWAWWFDSHREPPNRVA